MDRENRRSRITVWLAQPLLPMYLVLLTISTGCWVDNLFGTPAVTATCGDSRIDEGEACDGAVLPSGLTCANFGGGGGALSCAADCSRIETALCEAPAGCGNAAIDGGETCDGAVLGAATCESLGFTGGILACASNCLGYDTAGCIDEVEPSCGNGSIDGVAGEVCDGALLGSATCVSEGFSGGNLLCASDCLTFDTSGCSQGLACGNGTLEAGEQCDDGNATAHDGCSATCQTETLQWRQVTPGPSPSARNSHGMVYDASRQRVVLFGGYTGSSYPSDTWEWNGRAWIQVAAGRPSARSGHAMAFDSSRQRVILYGGGAGSSDIQDDTWEWNGVDWIQASTSGPNRINHAVAFDALRKRLVLFGGSTNTGSTSARTSEWDGSEWRVVSEVGPTARSNHAMAYDTARSQTVMFGGTNSPPVTYGWDGVAWTPIANTGPSARDLHRLTYDAARQRVVMFGGKATNNSYLSETWEWNGSEWTLMVANGPSARVRHALTYDAARRQVVLFGGYDGIHRLGDTWVYGYFAPGEATIRGGDGAIREVTP